MTLALLVACLAVLCSFGAGYALCEYRWLGKPQTCCRDEGPWHFHFDVDPPRSQHAVKPAIDIAALEEMIK